MLDTEYMHLALEQAHTALVQGEVPIGALLVKDKQVIATGYNQPISSHDPSAHAEIVCLRQAGKFLNNYRLNDCTLYVTIEPCAMCVGAMIHARISKVVFGTLAVKTGAIISQQKMLDQQYFNHTLEYTHGILELKCAKIMQDFFRHKRNTANDCL
jgi:tRNA(adenine34) deaminase